MTEQEIKRALNLVRYGGVVVTVTVFVALLAFAIVAGRAIDANNPTGSAATSAAFGSLLPYILILTVIAAVLSVILYFAYRAYLKGRAAKA